MATDTVSIEQFISGNGITLTAKPIDRNPNIDGSENMDNWKCVLRMGKSFRMTVNFSKGVGHHGAEPTVAEVLDCLASDAAGIANSPSFEYWCDDYGYDTDSRKAYKTYTTCLHQAARLQTFLGSDRYETLLWHTERL